MTDFDLRETSFLKVIRDVTFNEMKLLINPNDGADLGLYKTEVKVLLYYGYNPASIQKGNPRPYYGTLFLDNNCTLGVVVIGSRAYKNLGEPELVRLHLIKRTNSKFPNLLIDTE
jgi:hypothetical protein